MQVPLIRLQCGVNSYDWGKVGNDSAAAKFAAATPADDFSIQEEKPYAELWMGTHPSNPSKDLTTKRTLLDLVQDNQALLSKDVSDKFGEKLPFLFKVLSIGKALSIQAHPNKKLAEQLHQKDSKNYPDDNHKPEMTIAITPFDGLCGFRPLAEISHFLSTIPSLKKLVGESEAEEYQSAVKGQETSDKSEDEAKNKKALQKVFTALMNAKKEDVEIASKELVASAEEEGDDFAGGGGPSNEGKELADLVIRLNKQFPGDIGLFVQFFLNYVKLEVGEAMFLKADDIHAYLSGDIIECMAASDNVVRAGFTPKFKDVDTLTSMLTYSYAPISEQKMEPVDYPYATLNATAYSSGSSATLYDPPIAEFSVVKTDLKKKGAKATFEQIAGPSIFICTTGNGKISVGPKVEEVKPGYVYFVGATAEVILEAEDEEFTTFKAFCELQGKEDADGKEKL
ncbi:putative mannose-6-phosphate class i protein [Botrytis fragariae]|uniref:Mannose-6-phosphate isomerase n=1 Tax=Botrytis fragariae TaxID=1964551 RepID=A0A8H6AWC3_9HELO|nr:putative mannose-6-phosphate class i protein [Botrytis fragariae]KAF5874797.1 putative mannose-6-phosphate class i protein [Botrytis fragariae]